MISTPHPLVVWTLYICNPIRKPGESIRRHIFTSLDVNYFDPELFQDQTLSENPVAGEMGPFVGEIFMVGEYFDLVSEYDGSEVIQCFYYRQ